MFVSVPTGVDRIPCATITTPTEPRRAARARGSLATTDTRACLTMAAAAGLEASPTKFMSPTRNGVPLPYPICTAQFAQQRWWVGTGIDSNFDVNGDLIPGSGQADED